MRRNAHMRLTTFISRSAPELRQRIEIAILLVIAAFVLLIIYPAIEYAIDEAIVRTPGLGISNSWRASAVAAGAILIAVFSILRLVATAPSVRFLVIERRDCRPVVRCVLACPPAFHGPWQLEPRDLLRSRRRRAGGEWRADRFRVRNCDGRLCGAHHARAAHRGREPHGRRACRTFCCCRSRCSCFSAS